VHVDVVVFEFGDQTLSDPASEEFGEGHGVPVLARVLSSSYVPSAAARGYKV